MARIERGRPPIGLHTMAKPSKRVYSAGRQNHKVDQKQSQTDHATADPSTYSRQRYRRTRPPAQTQSKKRICLQKPCLQTAGDQTRGQTKVAKQTRMSCEMRIEPQNQTKPQKYMPKFAFYNRKRINHRRSNLIHNRTPG